MPVVVSIIICIIILLWHWGIWRTEDGDGSPIRRPTSYQSHNFKPKLFPVNHQVSFLKKDSKLTHISEVTKNFSNQKIALTNVKLPKNYKGTVIVTFTDINYRSATKLWFNRMTFLKYKNIRIYALDNFVYKEMLSDSEIFNTSVFLPQEIIDLPANFEFNKQKNGTTDNCASNMNSCRTNAIKKVWKIRMEVTVELLKQGYSVLLSDIDCLWLKYIDVETLPMNFDIIYSIGVKRPRDALLKWGFVLCGGLILYRPTKMTLNLWKIYLQECANSCDDQALMNHLYMSTGIKWYAKHAGRLRKWPEKNDSGLLDGLEVLKLQKEATLSPVDFHAIGRFDDESSGVYTKSLNGAAVEESIDISKLQIGVVDTADWQRNDTKINDCDGSIMPPPSGRFPWITHPDINKRGNLKRNLFDDWKGCFAENRHKMRDES